MMVVNLSLLNLKLIHGINIIHTSYSLQMLNMMFDECLILSGDMKLKFKCILCLKDSIAKCNKIQFADGYLPICLKCLRKKV